jgi:hypothetical protein
MLRGSTWKIERSPRIHTIFGLVYPYEDHEGCLDAPSWAVSGLLTRCDDGSTGGQYIQLVARGAGVIDSSVRVLVLDHAGQRLEEFAPFQNRIGVDFGNGVNWLIGGPSYGSGTEGSPADVALPVVLDPLGGTITVGGTFRGIPWAQDAFVYGTTAVPAPPPGYAYARQEGRSPTLTLPAPRNFSGTVQAPPKCGFGSHPSALFIRELSLACASGSASGQFVELGVRGGDLVLDDTYELRTLDQTGAMIFSMPAAFRALAGRVVSHSSAVLISAPGPEPRPRSDVQMPGILDPVAGTILLARNVGGVQSVLATLPYGTARWDESRK